LRLNIIIIIIVYFRHRVHRKYNKTTQRTDRKHRNIHKTTNQTQRVRETRTEIKTG